MFPHLIFRQRCKRRQVCCAVWMTTGTSIELLFFFFNQGPVQHSLFWKQALIISVLSVIVSQASPMACHAFRFCWYISSTVHHHSLLSLECWYSWYIKLTPFPFLTIVGPSIYSQYMKIKLSSDVNYRNLTNKWICWAICVYILHWQTLLKQLNCLLSKLKFNHWIDIRNR